MSAKLLLTAAWVALVAAAAEAKIDFGNVPLPAAGQAARRVKTTAIAFPGADALLRTESYAKWRFPLQLRRDKPRDTAYAPISTCRVGEVPWLQYVVGNFGANDEELVAVRYELFDACGKLRITQDGSFSRREIVRRGNCCYYSFRLSDMASLPAGKYAVVVTLNPGARPAGSGLRTSVSETIVLVNADGTVPEAGMPVYTLFDRTQTGLPVANCLVPTGYAVSGRVLWGKGARKPSRFFMTAYESLTWSQMTLCSPRPAKCRRMEVPIAEAGKIVAGNVLADDFESELLSLYGFGERTSRMCIGEEPADVPEAQLKSHQAIASRHGRTCTAVKTGRCKMTFYAVRNGMRFAVCGDIPYQLEEFDGRRTELTIVSVDSFCTVAGDDREASMASALSEFAKTRAVCPLFYSDARLPERRLSPAERESPQAIGAFFDAAMSENGLDGRNFKSWHAKISGLTSVVGASGRRHLVNSRFGHCVVNLSSGDALYWSDGFVDTMFSPMTDPRLKSSACDVLTMRDSAPRNEPRQADFFVQNGITEIRYDRVAMHDEPKPVRVLSVRNLSPQTKALLAKADVASWKTCYENPSVHDGMRWVVEFVSGDRVVKRVDCFNAEPPGMRYLQQACGVLPPDRRRNALREF